MFMRTLFVVVLAAVMASISARPGNAAKDPQGVAILAQSLNAVGGLHVLGAISDFSASGTITYFWAGQQVPGSATVLGRGFDQFRLDARLDQGTRSFAVSHGVGKLKDWNGLTSIPYHNTISIGILSLPYFGIVEALNDPVVAISYEGLVDNGDGRQAYQIEVERQFPPDQDPDGTLSRLTTTDYFVDSQTYLIDKFIDMTHPVATLTRSYPHEIDLGSYGPVNGVSVPMTVAEKVGGQMIWQLVLSSVSFNVGLSDSDFLLQ